jgi:D-amino-acid dehydrogenase
VAQQAVVIGGGAVGVASAYYLHQTGWQVTVVDRGEIGRGASYGNACLITPAHSHPLPGPGVLAQGIRWMLRRDSPLYVKPRLDPAFLRWAWRFRSFCTSDAAARGSDALRALSRMSLELFEELGHAPDPGFFYRRKGLLHVYLDDDAAAAARREREALAREGFDARVLSQSETLALEPSLNPVVRAGVFIEGDAHGHSYDFVQSLARRIAQRGARLLTGRAVSRIVAGGGRVRGVAIDGAAAGGGEELPADLVVLAAGAWTPAIAATVGVSIPVQPAKGYSCTIDAFPGAPAIPVFVPGKRVAITPIGDRLRFGGTLELAGFADGLDATRYRAVIEVARLVLGDRLQMKNEEAWFGYRPVTPDGLPVIARAPRVDGLIVAAGHAMLGFTQSPATGKLVAELANGQPSSVPLEPFRLDRF